MTNIDSTLILKIAFIFFIICLIGTSMFIWFQTPDLFEYFNQAFCAH